jgi:lipoyl synthase
VTSWLERLSCIEALEGLDLDPRLVDEMERRGAARPAGRNAISFYTPSFKAYASTEFSSCGRTAWPAVSVTGADCALQCDHCRGQLLQAMLPARTPEALWQVANEQIAAGARGMLLSGGSNRRNEVDYGTFLPTIARIKRAFPAFRIALHTTLVGREAARRMEDAGVDVAMLDLIGAQDSVQQVYHLKRPVADFEAALASLVETSMQVVPHIVIGLHYGYLLGEWNALEMVQRHRPSSLVLVVIMPFYATAARPFATPRSDEVGRFFLDARNALPDMPIRLGCARPPGKAKQEIDAYAVLAGLDGIAHPAEGAVELAVRLGRVPQIESVCCSVPVGAGAPNPVSAQPLLRMDIQRLSAAGPDRDGPASPHALPVAAGHSPHR